MTRIRPSTAGACYRDRLEIATNVETINDPNEALTLYWFVVNETALFER